MPCLRSSKRYPAVSLHGCATLSLRYIYYAQPLALFVVRGSRNTAAREQKLRSLRINALRFVRLLSVLRTISQYCALRYAYILVPYVFALSPLYKAVSSRIATLMRYATSITLNRWHYLSCVAADTDHHNPGHHPKGYRYGKAFRGAVLMPSRCSRPSVARALSLLSLLRPYMPCLRSERYLAVSLSLNVKHFFSRVALEHSIRNLAQCLFVARSVRARANMLCYQLAIYAYALSLRPRRFASSLLAPSREFGVVIKHLHLLLPFILLESSFIGKSRFFSRP